MTSPFRYVRRSDRALAVITNILEDIQASTHMDRLFQSTLSTQLDTAIFQLTGDSPKTPFITEAVLPDFSGDSTDGHVSKVDEIEQVVASAREAFKLVCENPQDYPLNESSIGVEVDPLVQGAEFEGE